MNSKPVCKVGALTVTAMLASASVTAQPANNPVNGAVQGSAPVSVVNVPTVTVGNTPLPVTGNVAVSGTIDARQSGAWNVGSSQNGTWFVGATQIGSWNVGILGTPTVTLVPGTTVKIDLGSSPLAIQNVNDASDVFQTSVRVTIPDNACCGEVGSFVVPSGKRLVIEDISASAHLINEQGLVIVTTTVGGNTSDHAVLGMQTGANQVAATGRVTRLYADPGTTVRVSAQRFGITNPATFDVALSGYYVHLAQ